MKFPEIHTYTIGEAAQVLSCNKTTVRYRIRKKIFTVVQKKPIRISCDQVDAFKKMRGSSARNYFSSALARLEDEIRNLRGTVAGGFAFLIGRAPAIRDANEELKVLWQRAVRMTEKDEWALMQLASLADMCHRRTSADLASMADIVGHNDCWATILNVLQEGQYLVAHHPRYSDDIALQALDAKLRAATIRVEQAAMILIFRKKPELHSYLVQQMDRKVGPIKVRRVLRDPINRSDL